MARGAFLTHLVIGLVAGACSPAPRSTPTISTPVSSPPTEPSPQAARTVAIGWDAVGPQDNTALDRAFASARQADTEDAWAHLQQALAEDLPAARIVALADPAFADIRAAHPELPGTIGTLEQRYLQALERGVPAFVYEQQPEDDDGVTPRTPYVNLRVGVYDPREDRFVPMIPPVDEALAAAFDLRNRRALVVSGALTMSMWLVTLDHLEARVFELGGDAPVMVAKGLVDSEMTETVSVNLDPDAPVVWVERTEISGISYYHRFDRDGVRDVGLTSEDGVPEDEPISDDFHHGEPSVYFWLRNGPDGENSISISHRAVPSSDADAAREHLPADQSSFLSIQQAADGTIVAENEAGLQVYRPPTFEPRPGMPGVHLSIPDLPVGEGGV